MQWIAQKWLSLTPELRESTLLFASTHKDRMAITTLIRDGLNQERILHQAKHSQATLKTKPLEPIQQRFSAYYQKGDVVRFNQDFKKHAIARNQYYTVSAISSKHRKNNVLPLVNPEGKTFHFALKSLPFYKTHTAPFERVMEIYQHQDLELQVGDKLMWTRNFKTENIRNGEIISLQAIKDNQLIFSTQKEGQSISLPKNHPALQHLDYGYVMTNYKVQGKDAPYGIGLIESYHRFGATMKNFYVQISRAVHGMTLITDNNAQLIEAIQRNCDEKSAALDTLSSQQLHAHILRFNQLNSPFLQPVIDKKIQFERKNEDLQFERVSPKQQFIKELER